MATIRVSVVGFGDLKRKLEKLNPAVNQKIIRRSLTDAALLIQADVAKNQIVAGRGKDAPPLPTKLTSRRGGAGLVGSIGINRKPLPFAIEVGTHLGYGPTHELGLGPYPRRAFLQPALDKISTRFRDIVVRNWKREAGL